MTPQQFDFRASVETILMEIFHVAVSFSQLNINELSLNVFHRMSRLPSNLSTFPSNVRLPAKKFRVLISERLEVEGERQEYLL